MSRDLEPGGVRGLRDRDPLERPGTHGRADELPDPERYRHTISARGTLLCTPAPVHGVSDRRVVPKRVFNARTAGPAGGSSWCVPSSTLHPRPDANDLLLRAIITTRIKP